MVKRALIAMLALPVLVMACDEVPGAAAPGQLDLSSCSSDAVQSLIGTNIASVDTAPLAASLRVIPPNTPVTMDYSAQRLNIETDAAGVITNMFCG